jgi:hypothetical protein
MSDGGRQVTIWCAGCSAVSHGGAWLIEWVLTDGVTTWSTLRRPDRLAFTSREEAEAEILAHPEIYGPLVEPPTEERP